MKTISIVNKVVASNLNLDIKTVELVNKYYWKDIVKNLTSLAEHPVHIKKIGTIVASPYKTNKYIQYLIKKIKKVEESTKYTQITKEKIIKGLKSQIADLWKKRNQFATEFYNKQNKKNESNK